MKDVPVATLLKNNENNHIIEIVLSPNDNIQIAQPIEQVNSPELNVQTQNCEIYQYCIICPLFVIALILTIYYAI